MFSFLFPPIPIQHFGTLRPTLYLCFALYCPALLVCLFWPLRVLAFAIASIWAHTLYLCCTPPAPLYSDIFGSFALHHTIFHALRSNISGSAFALCFGFCFFSLRSLHSDIPAALFVLCSLFAIFNLL
jgi:hypothetical protein